MVTTRLDSLKSTCRMTMASAFSSDTQLFPVDIGLTKWFPAPFSQFHLLKDPQKQVWLLLYSIEQTTRTPHRSHSHLS